MVHFAEKGELHIKNDTYSFKEKNGGISMKRKIATRIRRIVSFGLVLAVMLAGTSVYALAADTNSAFSTDDVENGMSVTYNVVSGEVTYGADQNYTPIDADSAELKGVNDEEIALTGIIGPDDRTMVSNTTAYPYNGICYVESTYPDGTIRRGTDSLVYSNVMLTSGDMVYLQDRGGWATQVLVIPALNSDGYNRPYGTAYGTNLTTNLQWTENKSTEWDWAIVDLDKSFSSWLGVGYNNNYTLYIGTTAATVGYPQDKGFQMWQDINSVSAAGERYLKALNDIVYGDNGAPLMALETGTVAGIIITEHQENGVYFYKSAVRINADLYSRIKAHISEVQ